MNKKLKNIERQLKTYVDNISKKQSEISTCMNQFMTKHSDDIVSLLHIKDSIGKACSVWGEPLINMMISELSLEKYPEYNFGFNDESMNFTLFNDSETLELTVNIDFMLNETTNNVDIKINWIDDNENVLELIWDVNKAELYTLQIPNMYHINQSNNAKRYMIADLIRLTIQTINAFDEHFDEYIDNLEELANAFVKDDEN